MVRTGKLGEEDVCGFVAEPFHLGRYVDEQVFRFNERKGSDSNRFATALKGIIGRKLTYKELIGNGAIASAA